MKEGWGLGPGEEWQGIDVRGVLVWLDLDPCKVPSEGGEMLEMLSIPVSIPEA